MFETCRKIVQTRAFQNAILLVIILTALLLGVKTSPRIVAEYGPAVRALDVLFQAIFVVEIALRVLAFGPRFGAFFRDGWNVFDFAVVALSLIPTGAGPLAAVARVARVLRVVRLVTVSPELRLIIGTMLRSIPSMGHVVTLLAVLLYVYAVIGCHLFREADPQHWSGLGPALLALFQVLTLEGWVEMQNAVMDDYPLAWMFFGSFVVIAVFVVINLFIAVVINNLQAVQSEQSARGGDDPRARIRALREQLDALERSLG